MNPLSLLNEILENGLEKDPRIMVLLYNVIRNPQDKEKLELLQRLMAPKLVLNKMLGKPFKESSELVNGLIKIGLTGQNVPVGFDADEPHCLIAGQTRSGKSVLLMLILGQAIRLGIKSWTFSKAEDIRNLLKFSSDVLVVNFSNQAKMNPLLPPPGVETNFWINAFADVFIQAFGLYDGTKNYLIENLNYLFSKNGMPAINDLYRLIKSHHYNNFSRFARYQESALNRLAGLINSIGPVLDYPCIPLEELAKRNVIFEIQGLTSEQQVFFVNLLLTWLFYYKMHHDNSLCHFTGVDDANLIFDKSFEFRPDHALPIISHLVSTVGKSKIIIIVCSQIPHQLGASIHSNSYVKIMFSLGNGRDIDFMTQSMGIKDKEQLQYCHRLGKREMVVKFAGRYQEPFLAYVPEINVFNDRVANAAIDENNARILSTVTLLTKNREKADIPVENEENEDVNDISEAERAFLWDVYNRPYASITERYKTVNLGG